MIHPDSSLIHDSTLSARDTLWKLDYSESTEPFCSRDLF